MKWISYKTWDRRKKLDFWLDTLLFLGWFLVILAVYLVSLVH